jgi:hypothetical protein
MQVVTGGKHSLLVLCGYHASIAKNLTKDQLIGRVKYCKCCRELTRQAVKEQEECNAMALEQLKEEHHVPKDG